MPAIQVFMHRRDGEVQCIQSAVLAPADDANLFFLVGGLISIGW